MNLLRMLDVARAYRAGTPLGDVVVLKAHALSSPSASVTRRLEPRRSAA
jgi:hypothetical protein